MIKNIFSLKKFFVFFLLALPLGFVLAAENGSLEITLPAGFSGSEQVQVTIEGTSASGKITETIILNVTSTGTAPAIPTGFAAASGSCDTGSIFVSWNSSSGATSYTLRRGGIVIYTGSATTYSDTGLTPGANYNYTVSATNGFGTSADASISATAPVTCITVNLSSTPLVMTLPNNSTTLSWTTTGNPTSCTATGSWSGSKAANGGSEVRSNLSVGTYSYSISCSKSGAPTVSTSKTVTVNQAGNIGVSLYATPSFMTLPTNATNLSWSTSGDPSSCTASGDWTGSKSASGSNETRNNLGAGTYYYTITCSKAGVPDSVDTETVTVVSAPVGSPDLISSSVWPNSATVGTATNFSSTVSNIGNGTTGSSFYYFFQVADAPSGGGNVISLSPNLMSVLAASATGVGSVSYNFGSAGTYSMRVCVDKSSPTDSGVVNESNELNNCGSWTNTTVSLPPPPPSTTYDDASCSITNFSPASPGIGDPITATLSITNTGTSIWASSLESGGSYDLVSENPQRNNIWGLSSLPLPINTIVNARYVRVYVPGPYNSWVGVREIEFADSNGSNVNPVSCSGAFTPGMPCTLAYDKLIGTQWNSGNFFGTATFDFGSAIDLSKIRLALAATPKQTTGVVYIQTSPNGLVFNNLFQLTNPKDWDQDPPAGLWYYDSYGDPGTTHNFTINATAPNVAGTYNFDWGMANGATSFGAICRREVVIQSSPVSVAISANPISVPYNGDSNISWSSTNATSCTVTPTLWTGISGSQTVSNIINTTTYTLRCEPGGIEDNVTVNVTAPSTGTLNVIKSGQGTVTSSPSGISCGTDCSESFPEGSAVVLTASPAPGRIFTGWGWDCGGRDTQCTVNISGFGNTVIANFAVDPNFKEF